MNKLLAVLGVCVVLFATAVMLFTADAYLWEIPQWAKGLVLVAAIGLSVNALAKPHTALSPPAIVVSLAIGLTLSWFVRVGGDGWWPVWLAVGVAMPLMGIWLLRSFSFAYRKTS